MWFLIGLLLGAFVGVSFMALLNAKSCSDCGMEYFAEQYLKNKNDEKEDVNADEICSSK